MWFSMYVRMNISAHPTVHKAAVYAGGLFSCACGRRSLAPRYKKPPAKNGIMRTR